MICKLSEINILISYFLFPFSPVNFLYKPAIEIYESDQPQPPLCHCTRSNGTCRYGTSNPVLPQYLEWVCSVWREGGRGFLPHRPRRASGTLQCTTLQYVHNYFFIILEEISPKLYNATKKTMVT